MSDNGVSASTLPITQTPEWGAGQCDHPVHVPGRLLDATLHSPEAGDLLELAASLGDASGLPRPQQSQRLAPVLLGALRSSRHQSGSRGRGDGRPARTPPGRGLPKRSERDGGGGGGDWTTLRPVWTRAPTDGACQARSRRTDARRTAEGLASCPDLRRHCRG